MKPFLKLLPTFLLILLYGFGILFRKYFWCDIPVVAGEPYGGGDIAELLIFAGVIGLSLLVLIQALVLLLVKRFKNLRLGALILFLSLVAALSYSQVHKLVAPVCS